MNRAKKHRQKKQSQKNNRQAPTQPVPQQQTLNLARKHFAVGQLSDAEVQLKKILNAEPNHPDALNLLGAIAYQVGKKEVAVELMNRAIKANPNQADLFCNLGVILNDMGQTENAIAQLCKAIALNPVFPEAHNNLGIALAAQKKFDEAVIIYQKAIALNSGNAKVHNNLGSAIQNLGRMDDAIESYRTALTIDPEFSEAHFNLGCALNTLEKWSEAETCFEAAIQTKPTDAQAFNNLGMAQHQLGKLDSAVRSYNTAIGIAPQLFEAYGNLSNTLKALGRLKDAETCLGRLLVLQPGLADGHRNLGLIQLNSGDLLNGWANYQWRWQCDDISADFQSNNVPQWQGEDVAGKRLLLWDEQGVGESLLFVSMANDLIDRGAQLVIASDDRLTTLFQRAFPSVTCIGKGSIDEVNIDLRTFDFHAPLGDIGRWLRPNMSSFPARKSYLIADESQTQDFRNKYQKAGNPFLIGIAWQSKSVQNGRKKSMTLNDFNPLFKLPEISFVDLQYGDTASERHAHKSNTGIKIIHDHTINPIRNLDTFASQVAAMDLVITISNSTAHMAGALGVPTLTMISADPLWYWFQNRDDNPWYPSLRLFRQQSNNDWQGVIQRIKDALSYMDIY